jgi:hypothetical protein
MSAFKNISRNLPSITLAYALLIGFAGDMLIRDAPGGIAFLLWILLIAGMACMLMHHAEMVMSRETRFWLLSGVIFSASIAWRDAFALQIFNFMATFFALAMVVASCRWPRSLLFASDAREIIRAFIFTNMNMITGIFPLVSNVAQARAARGEKRLMRILRASTFALILAIIFLALLRSADPIFASFATLPAFDFKSMIGHIVVTIIFTAAIGGAAYAALNPILKIDEIKKSALPFQLDRLEIVFVLGTLNILFGAFVLSQLSWLFGGEQFLLQRTGLSVAEYARSGFFQVVIIVALVIPVLLFSRELIISSRAIARLHSCLSIPIIFLLTIIIISSALKMQLYVSFYGLSTDRLYTLIFLIWLGFVLIWLALTVLRDRSFAFPSGVLISAFATLILMNIFVPDRIVANLNVARAKALDINYLATLSADAADISLHALLAFSPTTLKQKHERCAAAITLLRRWGNLQSTELQSTRNSWRFWNAGNAMARRMVSLFANELNDMCIDQSQSLLPSFDMQPTSW